MLRPLPLASTLALALAACGGSVVLTPDAGGTAMGPDDAAFPSPGATAVPTATTPPSGGPPGMGPPSSGMDSGSACSSPSVTTAAGPGTWPCVRAACAMPLFACAADCSCNDALSAALSCANNGGSTTSCFTTALEPWVSDSAVAVVVTCFETSSATCAANGGDGGQPPTCVAKTCVQQEAQCGTVGDGCGGTVDCGGCVPPEFCGGGGYSKCGGAGPSPDASVIIICTPATCQAEGYTCGVYGDGCGGVLECGPCDAGPG